MARTTRRTPLLVSEEEKTTLEELSRSRTAPLRVVERAKILLGHLAGRPLSQIAVEVQVARDTVYKCIDKALAMGVQAGLKDLYHRPKEPSITPEAKAWVVHLACTKPKDLGYAAEVWSRRLLAQHVRQRATEAGHASLVRAGKATVQRILAEHTLRPHKVKYYLERRDPEFERKMREVLLVYREVSLAHPAGRRRTYTVSVDEKPGVQALANVAPDPGLAAAGEARPSRCDGGRDSGRRRVQGDLPPVAGRHAEIGRDYEYKRLGTASILAALDLHDGHVLVRVERRHRSREFILLLKELDAYYPAEATIRVILDNHSAHVSKETRAFLASKPNRFLYVHTPTHASWLNLVESLFGKMARTFLRHIRVESWDELKARILKGVAEMNDQPVIFRWKKFDLIDAAAT